MRLRPDLGYYRRVLVNLFIATYADPEIRDCIKFAQETLNVLQAIRNEGLPRPANDDYLIGDMEKDAKD
jgi:hypothetical protein